jgi:microcompartment protein CcmL/EutN
MNSLGMLEFKSVAAGILACDACLKAAEVELIYSQPVCAGKYMIALKGDVGDVKSSIEAGENAVKELLISSIVIPNLHEGIFSAINATSYIKEVKALGIV